MPDIRVESSLRGKLALLVDFQEFLFFIEQNHLDGIVVGFVDIHLLASAQLSRLPLWTADRRLKVAAANLGLNYIKK